MLAFLCGLVSIFLHDFSSLPCFWLQVISAGETHLLHPLQRGACWSWSWSHRGWRLLLPSKRGSDVHHCGSRWTAQLRSLCYLITRQACYPLSSEEVGNWAALYLDLLFQTQTRGNIGALWADIISSEAGWDCQTSTDHRGILKTKDQCLSVLYSSVIFSKGDIWDAVPGFRHHWHTKDKQWSWEAVFVINFSLQNFYLLWDEE